MKRFVFCLIALCAILAGCFRPAFRTITVSVPQMKSQACAERIVDACKRVDGISNVVVNLDRKSVAVTFESLKIGIKNVEFTIAEAGFDADDIKANDKVRKALPPDCK